MASKLHGLTWAPSKRFVVVVEYNSNGTAHSKRFRDGYPVAAFAASGDPIVQGDDGLLTMTELLKPHEGDNPTWHLAEDIGLLGKRAVGSALS